MKNWIKVEKFKYKYLLEQPQFSDEKVLFVRWFENWLKKLKYNRI